MDLTREDIVALFVPKAAIYQAARLLAGICGITTAEGVLDVAERYLAGRPIPPKVQFLVEELFPDTHR
jgi:hypothetical protein